ncbi:MAG TPA: VOC family protein [Bacillota bacterium]|nr:VOC family protein [Bacillota bacterium]
MAVDLFIHFNGNCREAVEFYAKVFGIEKPPIMVFGDAPPNPEMSLPETAKNLVMFTHLNIYGSRVMFSDVFPGTQFIAGNNISLTINSKSKDELKRLFEQLKDGGKVEMELEKTFWSEFYGMLTDQFGIIWQFNYESGQAGK